MHYQCYCMLYILPGNYHPSINYRWFLVIIMDDFVYNFLDIHPAHRSLHSAQGPWQAALGSWNTFPPSCQGSNVRLALDEKGKNTIIVELDGLNGVCIASFTFFKLYKFHMGRCSLSPRTGRPSGISAITSSTVGCSPSTLFKYDSLPPLAI